jgi:hypothetical protein
LACVAAILTEVLRGFLLVQDYGGILPFMVNFSSYETPYKLLKLKQRNQIIKNAELFKGGKGKCKGKAVPVL